MGVSIIKHGDILIAQGQAALSDRELVELREALARRVGQYRSRGVVIDVSATDVLDSFGARTLREVARTIRLRGARTIVVGIQPDVAFAMVQLGLKLEGVSTALDLDDALETLESEEPATESADG